MVSAAQLRAGMAIRYEGQVFKVTSSEYHPGQGKMGGVAHARLRNVSTGALREISLRAELKMEEVPLEKQSLTFLYSDPERSYFMNPESYEQVEVENSMIGPQIRFLQADMRLPVEFVDGSPVAVVFPEIMEGRVSETPPPAHGQQDNTWKTARLENGIEILVPQFIKTGDVIRVEVAGLRYVDRSKASQK